MAVLLEIRYSNRKESETKLKNNFKTNHQTKNFGEDS